MAMDNLPGVLQTKIMASPTQQLLRKLGINHRRLNGQDGVHESLRVLRLSWSHAGNQHRVIASDSTNCFAGHRAHSDDNQVKIDK